MPLMTVPAREAIQRRNNVGRIATVRDRLEPYAKPQFVPQFSITERSRLFCLGSCFARNVERALESASLDVISSRFSAPSAEYSGTTQNSILNKYTPPSIWQELSWVSGLMERGKRFVEYADIAQIVYEIDDGRVIDGQLNGLKPVTVERSVERRQQIYDLFRQIEDCDIFVLTLGLIECWFDRARRSYIQQAPTEHFKRRLDDFEFHQLDFNSSFDFIRSSIELLRRMAPDLKIVITTSPVVLARTFTDQDLIVANNLSKSTLRAVAGAIAATENVTYFPSFEMATLTVGMPVYEQDRAHVRDDFVRRIISYFVESAGDDAVAAKFREGNAHVELASSDRPEAVLAALDAMPLCSLSDEVILTGATVEAERGDPNRSPRYETEAARRCEAGMMGAVTQAVSHQFNVWMVATEDNALFWRLADQIQLVRPEIFDMTYLRRARRLLNQNKLDDVLPLAKRAFERMPQNEVAMLVYATTLHKLGHGVDALRVLARLEYIGAVSPAAFRFRAKLCEENGEHEAALQSARAALCLKPDDRTSLRIVERLSGSISSPNLATEKSGVAQRLRSWWAGIR